ncbi:hypothetical protein M8818_005027 [Zalaria obscura]|uniref:Uncharacterized protein n=1 Tax=Zalaria obscura TaxID=2024903 RepID=A0ACC3S9V8_9PEZI
MFVVRLCRKQHSRNRTHKLILQRPASQAPNLAYQISLIGLRPTQRQLYAYEDLQTLWSHTWSARLEALDRSAAHPPVRKSRRHGRETIIVGLQGGSSLRKIQVAISSFQLWDVALSVGLHSSTGRLVAGQCSACMNLTIRLKTGGDSSYATANAHKALTGSSLSLATEELHRLIKAQYSYGQFPLVDRGPSRCCTLRSGQRQQHCQYILQAVLPHPVRGNQDRDSQHNARAAATTKECKAVVSGGKVVLSPTQYPKAVECLKVVEHVTVSTVTRTATTTVTITAATPITTSISTTTSTVISTSIAPAPSPVYAACQADNMLTHINGISIDGLGNFVTGLSGASASSAYDCCVQCVLAGSGCGGYAYLAGSCFFGTTTTCEGSATQNNALITFGSDDGDNVIAGNSNCGQFDISNF